MSSIRTLKIWNAKINEAQLSYSLVVIGLILFFLSDGVTKFLFYAEFDFFRISLIVRILFEFIFISIIILFINKQRLSFLLLFLFAFILFLTGQFIYKFTISSNYNIWENVSNFNKYYFVFIIYYAIYKIKEDALLFAKALKVFEFIILINCVFALVGLIFSISWLKTYIDQPYRNGYSGFFYAQNEASFFYFLSLSYFYFKHFILKNRDVRFYIVLVSSLVLGTKAIYLFLALLLLYHFIHYSTQLSKLIVVSFIAGLIYFWTWFTATSIGTSFTSYFLNKINQNGWLNMLLSARNEYVFLKIDQVTGNWNFLNYLVGGQDQTLYLTEMDFVDLYLFLGIVGCSVIFMLYTSTLFKFTFRNSYFLFFSSSFFVIAFFAGHFLSSAVCSLYFCVVSLYFSRFTSRLTL